MAGSRIKGITVENDQSDTTLPEAQGGITGPLNPVEDSNFVFIKNADGQSRVFQPGVGRRGFVKRGGRQGPAQPVQDFRLCLPPVPSADGTAQNVSHYRRHAVASGPFCD